MEENQKHTPGGRSENRRSNNRPRRESGTQPVANRGSNAQPKFDPHFVSAPEATPLRPLRKTPAQPAAKSAAGIQSAAQNERRERNAQQSRTERENRQPRSGRNERTEQRTDRSARPAQSGPQSQPGSRNNGRSGSASSRPAKSEAPRSRGGRAPVSAGHDEDPGLVLISRRPPQQKFTSFEEYMTAHGGATAPIEDHSDET